FEPGSTLKAFILAAAIEEKIANENSTYDCENGRRKVGPKIIRDVHPYGILTLAETLQYSSNICASKIGEKIGKENLYEYIMDFGFGRKLDVDLPGESSGKVQNLGNWGPVELATISFGQGISVTAIQLVNALSTIANGGYQMQPYVVKSIVSPKGEIINEKKPKVIKRVISYDTAEILKRMLRAVVEKGTGENAQISGYSIAGKTGTAQIPDTENGGYYANKYIASFMGFAPSDNPKLTLLVMLEDPKKSIYGGSTAAPIFKAITEKVLFYMGIPTEEEFLGNSLMPNLEGKSARDILRWAEEEGIKVSIKGNGYVIEQYPKPGETIKRGADCKFKLSQDI
ncbi:MAG: penicillin-binding protein, partial [Thermodesulfobacteriota bacterium]